MELLIIRHAKAEDFHPDGDFSRALVEKGHAQSRALGHYLKKIGKRPDAILSSPLVRARETAELIAQECDTADPVIENWLACGMRPSTALSELKAYTEFQRVAIVGHEPDLSGLACHLLQTSSWTVEMKKASCACFSLSRGGSTALLEALIPPKWLLG